MTTLNKYYILIGFLVISFFGKQAKAQLVADFVIYADSGCVPFVAQFLDSSSAQITYRHWDFGNGNTAIGNNTTPSASYNTSGIFNVTLTVSDGVDTVSITKIGAVSVFDIPNVSFAHQNVTTGCVNFPFSVNNTSPTGLIPIASWEWDFDDGSPLESGQNITHLYRSPGVFNVTLIITDALGCSSSFLETNLVNAKPKPVANFDSNDSLSVCGPPLTVNIFSTTTSSHPVIYNWTIGGNSYNTLNVNPTFLTSGGFDAELVVVNTIGCSDTLFIPNYIWIGSIIASMNIPDTACLNELKMFENTSFGGHDFYWDFGDGDTAMGANVFHAYSTPGIHTVTLVSSGGSTCDDTVTQDIFIETAHANFTSNPHLACETPFQVSFTDLSIGNDLSWEWRFGNVFGVPPFVLPNMSNLQHPGNTYWEEGTFDDTLIVTTRNGCRDTMIVVQNEEIIITESYWDASPKQGCFPLDVDFTNLADSMSRVATWWWEFNDGSPLEYSLNPSHTFLNVGIYPVILTIVSIDGCTATYQSDIAVGSQQNADFSIITTVSCASDTVYFTNLSSDTNLLNSYNWSFGDGSYMAVPDAYYSYMDTGYMDVILVASYNGCPDTLIVDSAIYINGPIIDVTSSFNCDSQNVVQFNGSSLGGTNWSWDFGDSSDFDTLNWSLLHTFPLGDGNYIVELTVWDSVTGCSDHLQHLAPIRFIHGMITPSDTTVCKGAKVVFNTGNSSNAISLVQWSIDGLSNQKLDNSNTHYYMNDLGAHTVYAVIRDIHGCFDTISHNYVVYQPVADYSILNSFGCAPFGVQFSDLSSSDTTIVDWDWDFGNGQTSFLQNPTFIFNGNGTTEYDISLTVTDTFGCANTILNFQDVLVIEPPSFFEIPDAEVCENSPVLFTNVTNGNYVYSWSFGDGTTSNIKNPVHEYGYPGWYDVSLTVIDSMGCDSTFVQLNGIEVEDTPVANFIANPSFSDCFPASIVFTDLSVYPNVDYWSWNFGDSPNFVVQYSPGAQNFYNAPGDYDVTLVVTTSFGCMDTLVMFNFINIGGPTGVIVHEPEIGCLNQDMVFSVDSINADAQKFVWDFGDGVVDTSYASNIAIEHNYSLPGYYYVSVIISDLMGHCQITDTMTIEVHEIRADFLITDTAGCSPLFFHVNNNSIGEDQINWLLDGIAQSQNILDSFLISEEGPHIVSLAVFSSYSQCRDTLDVEVTVFPNPVLTVSNDLTICIGDSVKLNAAGAQSFSWWPNTFLSNTNISDPFSFPDSNITYIVEGRNIYDCWAFDTINLIVQQHINLDSISSDTTIFLGSELTLRTFTSDGLWYSWSPPFAMGCTDCPAPLIKPSESTSYQLSYGDTNGCFQYDTSVVVEVLDEFKVSIPNTFTPGSDNLNDTFIPVVYGMEKMEYLRIYDRWGGLVFETYDITKGWDGTFRNKLVANNSAFSYTTRFRRYNGDLKDFVGVVIVLINGK